MQEQIATKFVLIETDGQYCSEECCFFSYYGICRHFDKLIRWDKETDKIKRCLDCRKATGFKFSSESDKGKKNEGL